ncbi:unnamed protein product [Oikopleura dioica]|nr:unnamed protein product [Oikopleura dioica]
MRDANWIAIDDEDDEQEESIKNLIANFSASLGGTDIREPLADILQLRQEPGVYRNIVVLTDGAVSNTEEVHELVKNEAIRQEGYLRFFALGIGNSASRSLCDGIAKHGRGSSVYVLDNDRIQAKASLILENASRPSIYLQKIALPSTLEVLGHSFRDPLDMSVFGFERIYLRLKSRNDSAVFRNLVEGVENGAFHLIINREPILMRNLDHTMQPWYNSAVKLTAFWAKQEINYLKDADMNYEERKRIQVEASINGGTLCDHTAFVGVMYRVGQERQEQAFQIQHEGSNTSSSESSSYHSGYMAASASSGPFGRPPASGGIGGAYSAGRAMFSGVSMAPMAGGLGGPPPMAGGLGGRPPMAGGIGGVAKGGMSKSFGSTKIDTIIMKRSKKRSEKLPNFDKLMSLVKTNGLWPASEGKAVLGCLMKYNKNFDKIFEDLRSRIEAVDLILTLMVLAALEKYEMNNQIEWARISSKAKTKLSKKNIDADAEIKALSMIL